MRPANPTYLLWIGDIAELANSVWGPGSAQTARLADALRGGGTMARAAVGNSGYLDRLRALDAVLAEFEAELKVVG